MRSRMLSLVVALVALAAFSSRSAWAADTHEGVIAKVGGGELHMTDKAGKNEQTFKVGADAAITRDGKAAKFADLKKGDMVTVTTKTEGAKTTVVKVDAKSAAKPALKAPVKAHSKLPAKTSAKPAAGSTSAPVKPATAPASTTPASPAKVETKSSK